MTKDVPEAKKALKSTLRRNVRHQITDINSNTIAIATGDKYSVKVKILGYYKPKIKKN